MALAGGLIGGGALVGAGVNAWSANQGRKSQATANANALADLRAARQRSIGYLKPYAQSGQLALSPLTGLLTGNEYNPTTGQSTAISPEERNNLFYQSPDYKFNLDQTQLMLQRSQAANGTLNSGGAQKEIAQYASGLASQQYNNYINQLFQLAGGGQSAATAEAQAETGFASNIANTQELGGQIKANYYNQIGQIGSGLGGAASGAGGLALFNGLQGRRTNPLASATGGSGYSAGDPLSNAAQAQSGSYGLSYEPLAIPA